MRLLLIVAALATISMPASAQQPFDADMCGDIRNGVYSMLGMADENWKVTRETPKKANDETYEQIYFWSQQAANYAQVYEAFCKQPAPLQ